MLIVGPSQQWAPLEMHSSPSNRPAVCSNSLSHVAPSAVPHGIQAADTPPKKRVPLMPFGPSLTRTRGTPKRSSSAVCQKSDPDYALAVRKEAWTERRTGEQHPFLDVCGVLHNVINIERHFECDETLRRRPVIRRLGEADAYELG